MKLFRKILFWCHLSAGVFAGIVVFIMSVTGVLLAYEKQLTYWADTRGMNIAPAANAQRISVATVVNNARAVKPDAQPTAVTFRAEPDAPASVAFGRQGNLYFDPYTGANLGAGSTRARGFFHVTTDLHRWLAAEGDGRAIGRGITGACNLAFLFIVMSGLYLWLPRVWTRKNVRAVGWFKRGVSGKARDFNWHNVIGIWCFLPLFIVVLSAVVMSYGWANNLVYRIAGEVPPQQQPPQQQQQRGANNRGERDRPVISTDGLDVLLARAMQHTSDWQTVTLQLPTAADAPVSFSIDSGNGGQPQRRATLALNRNDGSVARYETFDNLSRGRKLRTFMRFAHTGEYFGVIGQAIAGLASLGGAFLVWTGLSLAWRRFRAWRARRALPAGEKTTATTDAEAVEA